MAPLPISEAVIRERATGESYRRGQEYERAGAVLEVVRQGNAVVAEVLGSAPEPYQVTVSFDAAGITGTECTCPVEWGWCKHVVATLLVCLHEPDVVEEREPIAATIDRLDLDQLRAVLVSLAGRDATIARLIEGEIGRAQSDPRVPARAEEPKPTRPIPVDAKALRRQVRGALHGLDRMRSSEAYWHVGSVVGEVRGILEQAWAFIRAGDGATALTMLEAITDEYVQEWTTLDDSDGMAGEFFAEIGEAWTEALLAADLSADERAVWVDRLGGWADEVADYGIDDAFATAMDAAEIGWDDDDLEAVLHGESAEEGVWHGWGEEVNGGLTIARLNVLERQGRHDEYLLLARAAGLGSYVAAALVRLERCQEAADYGLTHFADAGQALTLAQQLRDRQELELAIAVGEHGLALAGPKGPLALWLRELAAGLGRRDLALAAAETAFDEERSLTSYLRVQELSGDEWPERRERILERLRRARPFSRLGPVEIFLHEGLIDDAIAVVDDSNDYHAIEPVVVAAIATRADWAIRASKAQAEPLMDRGQAQSYHHAVRWLGHARDAYLAANRRDEWQEYVGALMERHARKYKLVPMLKGLGR
jgi:uncharacterized Zn finger protein